MRLIVAAVGLCSIISHAFAAPPPAQQPVFDYVDRHHVILAVDRSGSFQEALGKGQARKTTFERLMGSQIWSLMTDASPSGSDTLYRPGRDCLSVLFFGLPRNCKDVADRFLYPQWILDSSVTADRLAKLFVHWNVSDSAVWSGITVANYLALRETARHLVADSDHYVFSKTFLITVSDERFNGHKGVASDLKVADDICRIGQLNTDRTIQAIDSVDSLVEIGRRNSAWYICFGGAGSVQGHFQYLRDQPAYPAKCFITEVHSRRLPSVESVIDFEPISLMEYRAHRGLVGHSSIHVVPSRLEDWPNIEAIDCLMKLRHTDRDKSFKTFWRGPLQSDSKRTWDVEDTHRPQFDGQVLEVQYRLRDPILGHITHTDHRVSAFKAEDLGRAETILMWLCPFPLSKSWAGIFTVAYLGLLGFVALVIPLPPRFRFDPSAIRADVGLDLAALRERRNGADGSDANPGDAFKQQIVLGQVTYRDTGKWWPPFRRDGKATIRDLHFSPRESEWGDSLDINGGSSEELVQPLVWRSQNGRFSLRGNGTLPVVLEPSRILDLSEQGLRRYDGQYTRPITRESSYHLDATGPFLWNQQGIIRRLLRLGKPKESRSTARVALSIKPHKNCASLCVRAADSCDFHRSQPLVVAEFELQKLEHLRFVEDLNVTLAIELRPRMGAANSDRLPLDLKSYLNVEFDEQSPLFVSCSIPETDRQALGGSMALATIRGRLPHFKGNGDSVPLVQGKITVTFEGETIYLTSPLEYLLFVRAYKGEDQIKPRDVSGAAAELLPPCPVRIDVGKDIALPRISLVNPLTKAPVEGRNLRDAVINNVARINTWELPRGSSYIMELSPTGNWSGSLLPSFEFGTTASEGEGEVAYTLHLEQAVVHAQNIVLPDDPKDAVDLNCEVVGDATRTPRLDRLSLFTVPETVIVKAVESRKVMRLDFRIRTQDIDFIEDAVEGHLSVRFPVEFESVNPHTTINEADRAGRFDIEFCLRAIKQPERNIIAVDFGTSAVAVGMIRKTTQGQLIKFSPELLSEYTFTNYENNAAFLPSSVGVFSNRLTEHNALPDREIQHCDRETGVFFPAPHTLEANHRFFEFLIPHLKMLIATNQAEVTIEKKKRPLEKLLRGVYKRLFGNFIFESLEATLGDRRADLVKNTRRVIFTMPNSSMRSNARMIHNALAELKHFHFDPDSRYTQFISESEAVAMWFLKNHLMTGDVSKSGSELKMLVYDCGAGTLDLSLRDVTIEGGQLRKSSLLGMLTVQGAGNDLDEHLATFLHEQLEKLNTDSVLRNDHGFFYDGGLVAVRAAEGEAADGHRSAYLTSLKQELRFTKEVLAGRAPEGGKFIFWVPASDAGSVVKLDQAPRIFKNKELHEGLTKEYGIRIRPTRGKDLAEGFRLRFTFAFDDLEQKLEQQNFYRKHVHNPLKVLLKDGKIQPDIVVLTGRTSLFYGLLKRLFEHFHDEFLPISTDPKAVVHGSRVWYFSLDKMKSAVVEGALAYADRSFDPVTSSFDFSTTTSYGYYGLLLREEGKWKWHHIVDHKELDRDDARAEQLSPGKADIDKLDAIHFIYSMVDPRELIEEFNEKNRPFAGSPLDENGWFMQEIDRQSNLVERLRAVRRETDAKSLSFWGSVFRRGGLIPEVYVHLAVADQPFEFSTSRQSNTPTTYDVWPYKLWHRRD